MPPYIKNDLRPPLSDTDILLAVVQQIQEMLPDSYQINVVFRRLDTDDEPDESFPAVINGDMLNEEEFSDVDFELFSALEELALLEEALPFLKVLEQRGQDDILFKLNALEQEDGTVEDSKEKPNDCPLVK